MSKRYFSGPSWDELLQTLAERCPIIDKGYPYYKQTLKNPIAVGEEFARLYQQWAWEKGRNQFPADMFTEEVLEQDYMKYTISRYLQEITPKSLSDITDKLYLQELQSLQAIKPHAVITTNFDQFLEMVFPDYQPVIGQNIIHGSPVLFGEVFKIHGCVSDYKSLVFTSQDYEEFMKRKKYLSAKLLTFFSEHPLLFLGYSASDPNVRAILSDIGECFPRRGHAETVIPNIYFAEWRNDTAGGSMPSREKLIGIEDGRSVRVKSIETKDFGWVFDAFGANQPLNAVSPKILRALLHRSYDLVRHDIPRKTVQADFQMLERAVSDGSDFAKLFGITTIADPSRRAADFPYTISEVAEKVTGKTGAYWTAAQPYFDRVKRETGMDLKKSDNRYHSATRVGRSKNSVAHKYSEECVSLFMRMKNGQVYEVCP